GRTDLLGSVLGTAGNLLRRIL
ncbi:oxidoreductase, partial [Pseudomonas aeruginosa]